MPRPLAVSCVLVLAATLVGTRPVYARDDVLVSDDAITIAVHIDLVGGTSSLARRWSAAIDKAWNRGNQGKAFTFCGRQVQFLVDMQAASGNSVRPEASRVKVEQLRSGQYLRGYVSWPNSPADPGAANFRGDWASNSSDATIAHEFGHLIGLPDEYVDLPGQVPGSSEEYSVPLPQYADDNSIMANHNGVVLPRHIADVIRHHSKLRSLFPCRWRATISSETMRDDETVAGHATGNTYPTGAVPHNNGAWTCYDTWQGAFEFTIDGDWPAVDGENSLQPQNRPPGGQGGTLSGTGSLKMASHTCSPSGGMQLTFKVGGAAQAHQIQLRLAAVSVSSGVNWGGIEALFDTGCANGGPGQGRVVAVPLSAPDKGEAQIKTVDTCYTNTFTSTNTISLVRVSK